MEVIEINLAIGNKIKALRESQKICQQDLCGELINRTTLSKIENEKMYPSIPQLIYISKKLNMPISFFLEEESSTNKIKICANCSIPTSISDSSLLNDWYNKKRYSDILKLYELEFDKFKTLEDFNKYFYLGMSLFNSGLSKPAQKPLKKYINQYTKTSTSIQHENISCFTIALNHLFAIMYQSMNYLKAEHYLVMAKKHLQTFNEKEARYNFIIHCNLGILYNTSNQYEKTIKVLENFLSENSTRKYLEFIAQTHLLLNIAYYNVGEYKKSIDHIKKAIFFYDYVGDKLNAINSNLNLINAYRYDNNFNYALKTLDEFKDKTPNYEASFPHFLVQEMILFFNMKIYNKTLEISRMVTLGKLNKVSKSNFNFIMGHINFIELNYALAYKQLLICEKIFLKENFSYDLVVLYNDLYLITEDEIYKNKSEECSQIRGRKNIIV